MSKWTRRAFITTGVVAGGGVMVGIAMRPGNQIKDLAPKLLVTQLQMDKNLPVTPSNYRPTTQSSDVVTLAVAFPSKALGLAGTAVKKDHGLGSTV